MDSTLSIDAYALVEALTGRKLDRRPTSSGTLTDDFEDVAHINDDSNPIGQVPQPDKEPEDVHVGVINPFALAEALIGHQLDMNSAVIARIISDILQTDYEELFDLKYNSALFAGLRLNEKDRVARPLSKNEMKILGEADLVTPDFSRVQKLQDLEQIGLKHFGETKITRARMQNGKLHVVLEANSLGKKVTNTDVTMTIHELALPFRNGKESWVPPNSAWENAHEVAQHRFSRQVLLDSVSRSSGIGCAHRIDNNFDNPIQGAATNCWLISAIFSVFWADPSSINRAIRLAPSQGSESKEKKQVLSIKFHDKGGRNNASTATVDVDYEIPVNNSSMHPIYCHTHDGKSIWPSLYEKAYAKWISKSASHQPDLTQLHNGDPVKALAQINGKKPLYYFTEKHSEKSLVTVVRSSCVNHQTINPMVAWTHATGRVYKGSNLVANHAYSVLGWACPGDIQYIILRNPFGVTEPKGLTSSPGLIDQVIREFWPPACFLSDGGVLALEASAFKEYFACLGLAK